MPVLPGEDVGIADGLPGRNGTRAQRLFGCWAMTRRAPAITRREFDERRSRAAEGVRRSELDALLVCGRGGGALDRYGDVMYLTNFYSSFPFIPDYGNHWSARAHPFVVLHADGRARLIADIPFLDEVAMPREDVVQTDRGLEALLEEIRGAGLDAGRLGIAGYDTLPASYLDRLRSALPEARFEAADYILSRLRSVKSPAEVEHLAAAAEIGSKTIEAMLDRAVAGATHGDVVAAGQQVLVPAGGILYNSFMASGTGGDHPTACRSIFPTWANPAPLEDGQWLRLGISGVFAGYYLDVSRSKAIGKATNRQIDAFEAAISVVEAGIEAIHGEASAAELAVAGIRKQQELGYPMEGVFSGLGHGIGMGWDAPWLVPDDHTPLVENMVINLEKTLAMDGYVGDFEESVLITRHGHEVLTKARKRHW